MRPLVGIILNAVTVLSVLVCVGTAALLGWSYHRPRTMPPTSPRVLVPVPGDAEEWMILVAGNLEPWEYTPWNHQWYRLGAGLSLWSPAAWSGVFAVCSFVGARSLSITAQVDAAPPTQRSSVGDRPRLLVLTDIGGDPDDTQSMIRLMLYANEFEIEGLVASAAGTPGELKERATRPELIREIVEAYGKVRANLAKHDHRYPAAEELLGKVKSGNPDRGRDAVGEGKDTEASQWIIGAVDRDSARLLNISIWGGQTDLAQALWRVRKDRGAEALAKFVARLRVYDVADQDKIAEWMWAEFPGMFSIRANAPKGADRRAGAFRGMDLGGDESLTSRAWAEANVVQNHGALGALYPMKTWTAPNPHGVMKEGDTPSWFYFLANGLSDADHPEWGGWGGRFELDPTLGGGRSRIYRDALDAVGKTRDARASVWRWRPAFAADFAARLNWCVGDAEQKVARRRAVTLNGGAAGVVQVAAVGRQEVKLTVDGTADRSARWFVYTEAGTYRGDAVGMRVDAEGRTARFQAPEVTEPKTVHVICEAREGGRMGAVSYGRAIVTVRPKEASKN